MSLCQGLCQMTTVNYSTLPCSVFPPVLPTVCIYVGHATYYKPEAERTASSAEVHQFPCEISKNLSLFISGYTVEQKHLCGHLSKVCFALSD